MGVITTEGIVLRRRNFGEADRIVTFLTPYRGKINIIAKGVRKITSRRAGSIELLNQVRIQIFEGKGLGILTEADSLTSFPKIKASLPLTAYASHVIEITDRLLAENQLNTTVYTLVIQVLKLLELNPRQIFIRAYEVKLLSVLGFWSSTELDIQEDIRVLLNNLVRKNWKEISEISIDESQAMELERIMKFSLEKILESDLRSMKILVRLATP